MLQFAVGTQTDITTISGMVRFSMDIVLHSVPKDSSQFSSSHVAPATATVIHSGLVLELTLPGTSRHSCPVSHSSSLQFLGAGTTAQIALLFDIIHAKPFGHSTSLQSRGIGLTLTGTQRTTEGSPSRSRSKHSIPSSQSNWSQVDGGGGGMHLGRGPTRVSLTTHTVSGGHKTKLQFITGGGVVGRMQRALMYCLQFRLVCRADRWENLLDACTVTSALLLVTQFDGAATGHLSPVR